jgi:hypothetical protein
MNCLNYLAPTDLKNPLRIGMLPNFNAQLGVDTYSSLSPTNIWKPTERSLLLA